MLTGNSKQNFGIDPKDVPGVESFSVMVVDPPADATNADAWQKYFSTNFGEVIPELSLFLVLVVEILVCK